MLNYQHFSAPTSTFSADQLASFILFDFLLAGKSLFYNAFTKYLFGLLYAPATSMELSYLKVISSFKPSLVHFFKFFSNLFTRNSRSYFRVNSRPMKLANLDLIPRYLFLSKTDSKTGKAEVDEELFHLSQIFYKHRLSGSNFLINHGDPNNGNSKWSKNEKL